LRKTGQVSPLLVFREAPGHFQNGYRHLPEEGLCFFALKRVVLAPEISGTMGRNAGNRDRSENSAGIAPLRQLPDHPGGLYESYLRDEGKDSSALTCPRKILPSGRLESVPSQKNFEHIKIRDINVKKRRAMLTASPSEIPIRR
jgi:hypothetical protein